MKMKPENDNAEWKRKYIQAMVEKQKTTDALRFSKVTTI